MRKLRENALRTRQVLERETQPLSEECRAVIAKDVARTLGEYFCLTGDVTLRVVQNDPLSIVIEAKAESILPFGVMGRRS